MIRAKITTEIPMLSICPVSLIVPKVEEATPYAHLSTDPMTALVFGEEKRANPKPRQMRLETMKNKDDDRPRSMNIKRPALVIPIPAEATTRGSTLSESLPARGEKTAMTIGWAIRMSPAC